MTGALAKRYARALASVASEQRRLEEVCAELERTAEWLADPELAAALAAPNLGPAARRGLIGSITEALGLSELTTNFLGLLAQHNRLGQFRAIVEAYRSIVDRELGRVRARIRSAQPLSPASLAEISRVLDGICAKKVLPTVEVDGALIGGLTVEIEGRVYDGSVRTQLEHLARAMAREEA
jgi:F-type H+-transporting ATPase subunit delta